VARAAQAAQIPCVISFTVETDGRLPTGDNLADAIEAVDAATERAPAYYMINCAHPTHFERVLDRDAAWLTRLRGLRANSSRRSHAELDNAMGAGHRQPRRARRTVWRSCVASRTSTYSAAAAERTTGTWNASAWPAGEMHCV
jgi:S-methylmethionine-dependent homocysteine/selenocysteine methylase